MSSHSITWFQNFYIPFSIQGFSQLTKVHIICLALNVEIFIKCYLHVPISIFNNFSQLCNFYSGYRMHWNIKAVGGCGSVEGINISNVSLNLSNLLIFIIELHRYFQTAIAYAADYSNLVDPMQLLFKGIPPMRSMCDVDSVV